MMRRCMVVLALTLMGCGGDGPVKPPQKMQVSLAVIGGNQQAAPVASLLPTPIRVQVTETPAGTLRIQRLDGLSLATVGSSSTPAPGRLVKFVADSGCGSAAIGYGITDADGVAVDRWTLGTRAQPCLMVTIGVDQKTGEIQAYDTAYATALPGAVDTLVAGGGLVFLGESFPASALARRAADKYGNAITNPEVAIALPAGWTLADGAITAPATEQFGEIVVQAGARSAAPAMRAVRDLRPYRFDASWSCDYRSASAAPKDGRGKFVYTAQYRVAIDTVTYSIGASEPFRAIYIGLPFHGVHIRTMEDGVVDTLPVQGALGMTEQRPDTLVFALSRGAGVNATVRSSDSPLSYTGGYQMCEVGYDGMQNSFQMVAR